MFLNKIYFAELKQYLPYKCILYREHPKSLYSIILPFVSGVSACSRPGKRPEGNDTSMETQLLRTNNCISEQIEKFGDMVYRLGIVYLKNEQDVQDMFQEVFLRLFEKQPVFQSEEHEKAWLITVASNYCKNLLRTVWYRKTVPLDELCMAVPEPEEREALMLLLRLPVKYRRVLYLHYYEGYSTDEIGTLLHINPATVRTQLKRGRELLKTRLTDDSMEQGEMI